MLQLESKKMRCLSYEVQKSMNMLEIDYLSITELKALKEAVDKEIEERKNGKVCIKVKYRNYIGDKEYGTSFYEVVGHKSDTIAKILDLHVKKSGFLAKYARCGAKTFMPDALLGEVVSSEEYVKEGHIFMGW